MEYQIDAANQMLVDFCSLLPELYDDSICTHNTHLCINAFTKVCKTLGTALDSFWFWDRE